MAQHEPARPRLVTPRIEVRHVVEADRPRFVELFCDEGFMVFSGGALSPGEANERFDQMVVRCAEIPFAKQPIVERCSGAVIGYTGVDRIELDGRPWLEWGYRLAPAARGKGYATEASELLITAASTVYSGDILAIIHPDNEPSQNVSHKLGFRYWKTAAVMGEVRNLYRLRLPNGPRRSAGQTG
jgi:RimJ/RimL family protein N-acetyltransferase